MTEAQLKSFPAFRTLPVYDESDQNASSITPPRGMRECSTIQQVEECLRDAGLKPLGALRASHPGGVVVVAYFGERDGAKSGSQ
jgi:hypothetical protein